LHSETKHEEDDDDEAVKALTPRASQHIMAAMKVEPTRLMLTISPNL
jgi:hypothetical protein